MLKRHIRVYVYRNLNDDCFSLRDTSTGRVIAHSHCVQLGDVQFRVGEKGRQRVIREHSRNVHAGVIGYLVIDPADFTDFKVSAREEVRYNPYLAGSFVNCRGQAVHEAPAAWLRNGKVFI